jgi:hypothetical protein
MKFENKNFQKMIQRVVWILEKVLSSFTYPSSQKPIKRKRRKAKKGETYQPTEKK